MIPTATLESENGLLVPELQSIEIDSFAKNHENNDGHRGLLVDPEVALQSAVRKHDKDGDWWFSTNHMIIQ